MFSAQSAQLQEILVGGFVIFMMLSVGLDLTGEKIKAVFKSPKILCSALVVNYVIIPIIFLGLITIAGLEGMWATGLLFVAVAPGGPVAGVLVQNAKGNLALGVSLIVIMNILNTLLTPIGIWVLNAIPSLDGGELPILGMVQTIMAYQIVPLFIAMQFRKHQPQIADQLRPYMERAAKGLLILVAIAILISEFRRLLQLPPALLVVIHAGVAISFVVAWWLTPGSKDDKAAIALTAPYRCISVVLLLLTAWVRDVDALIAAMAYSVAMLWMCLPASAFIRRRLSR